MSGAPWSDCKVAFPIRDTERLWKAETAGRLTKPAGWSLDETDSSGARAVVVFRVEGVPSVDDGRAMSAKLKELRL